MNTFLKKHPHHFTYHTWRGKNRFCCNGSIYIGSEYHFGILTNIYINIYCWLFIIFVVIVSKYCLNIFKANTQSSIAVYYN